MKSSEVSAANRQDLGGWERAEIARSDIEAALTSKALRLGKRTRARYEHPPADTTYPLEYAYCLLGNVRDLDVLDLGCGSGANTTLLVLRGARVCGLDLSPALIQLAIRRLEANGLPGSARFLVGSVHDLPVPDSAIDVVFGIAILHHLDIEKASREVFRILKPGGRAIFQEPIRNSRLIRMVRSLIPYRAPDLSPFERPLNDTEVSRFARPFRSIRARAFCLPHVSAVQVIPGFKRWTDAAYRLDGKLLHARWLQPFAGIRVFELTK